MANPMHKLKEEFLKVLPPTIFFFVALHVIAVVRLLMAKGTGFEPQTSMSILVASLILGKAVLIADMLPLVNRYPHKPLAYNVVWKTVFYLLIAGALHYLERLYDFSREAGSIAAGHAKLVSEIVWPHFWAVQIVLLVLILMYCTARELVRVIGRDEALRMFFGPSSAAPQ
jgi:hypothetical protein